MEPVGASLTLGHAYSVHLPLGVSIGSSGGRGLSAIVERRQHFQAIVSPHRSRSRLYGTGSLFLLLLLLLLLRGPRGQIKHARGDSPVFGKFGAASGQARLAEGPHQRVCPLERAQARQVVPVHSGKVSHRHLRHGPDVHFAAGGRSGASMTRRSQTTRTIRLAADGRGRRRDLQSLAPSPSGGTASVALVLVQRGQRGSPGSGVPFGGLGPLVSLSVVLGAAVSGGRSGGRVPRRGRSQDPNDHVPLGRCEEVRVSGVFSYQLVVLFHHSFRQQGSQGTVRGDDLAPFRSFLVGQFGGVTGVQDARQSGEPVDGVRLVDDG